MLVSLTPRGGTEYTLIAEDHSTPFVLQAQDWGNAAWEHTYAGSRGTQGARPAQGTLPNRTVRLQLRLYGQSTDGMAAKQAEVEAVMDALRRRGGWITRRAHGQTYLQRMEVLTTPGLNAGEWSTLTDTRYILSPILEFVCAPYALGEPMAWSDPGDAIPGRVSAEVGSLTNLVVNGGVLGVAGGGAHLLVDSLRGYRYGDVQVSARIIPGTSPVGSNRRWGVLLRYLDPGNWLAAALESESGTGYVRLRSCIGGTESVVASATLAADLLTWAQTGGGWLVGRIDSERVQVQAVRGVHPPASPWVSAEGHTTTITGAARDLFGPGTEGRVGLYGVPQNSSGTGGWQEWRVQPLAVIPPAGGVTHRQAFPLRMNIPGTAPALAEVTITRDNASGGGTPGNAVFGMLAWSARRGGWNRCGMGDFGESLGAGATTGWGIASVTGITLSATSLTADAGGATAVAALTGSTGSGVSYRLADEFRAGRTYRATCQIQAVSGSPLVQLALGKSGDLATGTAQTGLAAPAWINLSVEWTPAVNAYGGNGGTCPHVALRTSSSASGSVRVRRVQVIDITDEPVLTTQIEGRHGRPPLGVVPYGGGGWLVEHHAGGTLEWTGTGGDFMPDYQRVHTITGAGHLTTYFHVDPALAGADDHTAGGTLDVELWMRAATSNQLVSPRVQAFAMHPADTLTSRVFATPRLVAPWGETGKPLVPVPSGSILWGLHRIGVLSLSLDEDRPAVWRVAVSLMWGAGSAGSVWLGGFIVAPVRSRALTPTGVRAADGGYPLFFRSAGGDGRTIAKTVRPDLSAIVGVPPARGAFGDCGLGGSLIELPTGQVDFLPVTVNRVPDDPAPVGGLGNTEHQSHLAVAVSPTPRWGHLRD